MKTLNVLIVTGLAGVLLATCPTGCSQRDSEEKEGKSSAPARVKALGETSFDAEIREGVVLVDFWATWCGPCKMQAPIVEKVAAQVEGKAKVASVDVDEAPDVAKRFNIRSIPTLVV